MSAYNHTVAEIAEELGCSRSTVKRAEASALAKIAAALTDPDQLGPERLVRLSPMECLYLFAGITGRLYLARLMKCRPYEYPDDEPTGL